MRRAARQDSNHQDIKRALRTAGWHIEETSGVGAGFPDLIAIKRGRVEFIEVKDGSKPPSARKLTPLEAKKAALFMAHGRVIRVIETVEQARSL